MHGECLGFIINIGTVGASSPRLHVNNEQTDGCCFWSLSIHNSTHHAIAHKHPKIQAKEYHHHCIEIKQSLLVKDTHHLLPIQGP
jgi:hypothetical protein